MKSLLTFILIISISFLNDEEEVDISKMLNINETDEPINSQNEFDQNYRKINGKHDGLDECDAEDVNKCEDIKKQEDMEQGEEVSEEIETPKQV